MRKLLLGATVVALSLTAASPASANHSWENYHWGRTANPFTLKVVDSVTGVWDSILPAVNADWNSASPLNIAAESGASDQITRLLCQPTAGKIRACNANYGPNLWFGLATIWLTDGHISQATTQVNDFYFTGSYGNDVARRHVLCQEIGHDFGLDHHAQASCMDDTNSTLNNTAYQSPNSHDYQQLASIYQHTDGSNTYRSTGVRPDRVVRTIGNTTVITHILWVE